MKQTGCCYMSAIRSILRISILSCLLLSIQFCAIAQIPFIRSTDSIAEIEKKAFISQHGAGQIDGLNGLTRVASSNDFDINYYRCEWNIDPAVRYISGKVTSYFTITTSTNNIVFDLSDTLNVDSITYHGNKISYQRPGNDGLKILFSIILNIAQKDSVAVFYSGVPRGGAATRSFTQSTHNGTPVIWTLSEPYGAKEWWPCKNGLDDKADSIDIIITSPAAYQTSSNGILVSESIMNASKVSVWKHRYPCASYLIALACTNYTVLKDTIQMGNKTMDLVNYAYPESVNNFSSFTFTKYILNLFNRLFVEYPFSKEKYGFTQFLVGGGMEHQTNSFVDNPSVALVAHETGHQWFGDRITCGSWRDIWLNEGFASYCQVLNFEDTDKDYFYLTLKSLIGVINAVPDGSVWVDDTTSVNRIFSQRLSYYKGCYLLHMLRGIVGDSAFFKGVRRYLNDPLLKYNFAKTDDLKRNLELESGKDLTSFFKNWFYNQGYPTYNAEWTQDTFNNVSVRLNQTTSHASVSFFDMPVPIQFKNSNRDTVIVFNNTKNNQSFLANPGFHADTAIVDPYYWILCSKTIQRVNCDVSTVNDSLPFYKIQWFQNINNWTLVDIVQTNTSASAASNNIPVFLHLTNNGIDSTIAIANTGTHFQRWINTTFKVSNAFVTTSCLMNKNYSIANQPDNSPANSIKVYPIPLTGNVLNVSIKNPSDKSLTASLFNLTGQLIYKGSFNTPGKDEIFELPLYNLPKGLYILKLNSASSINLSKKIIR